jgi:hypothetical protein
VAWLSPQSGQQGGKGSDGAAANNGGPAGNVEVLVADLGLQASDSHDSVGLQSSLSFKLRGDAGGVGQVGGNGGGGGDGTCGRRAALVGLSLGASTRHSSRVAVQLTGGVTSASVTIKKARSCQLYWQTLLCVLEVHLPL